MRCPIQVISLETSLERRRVFIANNPHIAFDFFNAVDGFQLSSEEIRDPLRFIQPLHYSAGAYGCALSHRHLWERALHSDDPLTIAEDDALFRWDFEQRIQDVFDRMPAEWDIILWGWNFDSILSLQVLKGISPAVVLFDQGALRNHLVNFQASREEVHPIRLDQCFGTPAYSISSIGARKFLDACFPIRDFILDCPFIMGGIRNNGIDVSMNQIYGLTQAYACFPPLAVTPNHSEESTIEKMSSASRQGPIY
jgi:GR25 family glycosyltransferase involved in LPS biosynthesis